MPKLIVKQNNGVSSQQSSMATWLSVGGLLILLIAVASAAFFVTKTPLPGAELEPLALSSARDEGATMGYQSLHAILSDLMAEYEGLAGRGVDDYQKHLMLLGKAESILGHVEKMDVAAEQLGLDAKESGEVSNRHQFYQDFWQAKLHFRELRVSRFEKAEAVATDAEAQVAEQAKDAAVAVDTGKQTTQTAEPAEVQQYETKDSAAVSTGTTKPKFQFAKPPEGMAMPAGFCDLGDPDNSCKPEDGAMAGSDLPVLDNLALPEDLPLYDLALPEDLPALDDLALPEALPLPPLPEGELPLADDSVAVMDSKKVDSKSPPKKPKFQFAKPPEGMAMPAGFCDLGDPDNSCKPEDEAMTGSDLPALDGLDLPLDNLALPEDLPLDDLALPEDLPALDDLALPEALPLPPLPGGELPLADDSIAVMDSEKIDSKSPPKKPKFQFAKPPEGMAMPAGFCDLGDPDNSCKPAGGAMSGSDLPALGDLDLALPEDLPLDDLTLPSLPALDDLALPEVPGDLLSDVDQPVLNGKTELDGATDKSQL